jgi:hypothetical protein
MVKNRLSRPRTFSVIVATVTSQSSACELQWATAPFHVLEKALSGPVAMTTCACVQKLLLDTKRVLL